MERFGLSPARRLRFLARKRRDIEGRPSGLSIGQPDSPGQLAGIGFVEISIILTVER
jgi:hypothetical protein